MVDPLKILYQYWGYTAFRPMQEDIIRAVMDKKDTLALLPTGGGKSICFQVPALGIDGVCIVVSPLIALMKDQVFQLNQRGIKAKAIYSGLSNQEIDIILDNAIYGDTKFLYVSPERLKTELFIARTTRMQIGLLAIDEAHCISQWGYDFRPPYLEIAQFRKIIPQVPCIALTATATKEVKVDIREKLHFSERAAFFQKSFARANLSYSAFYEENKEARLLQILKRVPGTAVVYVRSRKRTKAIADFLVRNRISASFYHAGLSNEQRAVRQDEWIQDKIRVIVATNAFGMGIDKPDVRLVVHVDLPDNLEAYYQEAGRAGRDEKKAYAVLLYNKADIDQLKNNIEVAHPSAQTLKKTYQALANYLQIAVGSGFMESYNFDIDDFVKTFKLPYLTTYHALKKLEEQGFIQFNEAFYSPSRLGIITGHEPLYQYQVANKRADVLIKILLRIYGGELFNHYLNINEKKIAQALNQTTEAVIKQLLALQQAGIVNYEPTKDTPQIVMLTERLLASKLPLNNRLLAERKKAYNDKVHAVINYAEDTETCQTALLLRYFNEFTKEECGICGNCTQKKRNSNQQGDLQKQILNKLAKEPIKPEALLAMWSVSRKEEVVKAIDMLLQNKEITYTASGALMLLTT